MPKTIEVKPHCGICSKNERGYCKDKKADPKSPRCDSCYGGGKHYVNLGCHFGTESSICGCCDGSGKQCRVSSTDSCKKFKLDKKFAPEKKRCDSCSGKGHFYAMEQGHINEQRFPCGKCKGTGWI